MVVCPVCEHAQAVGPECEVCGRSLAGAPEAGPPAPGMDGLEPTLRPSAPDPAPEDVPGLERTGLPPAPAPAGSLLAELEATRAAPVEAQVEPVPDVERVGGGEDEERTPYPAVVVCRYCRTEAAFGARICERCGMRLPTAQPPAPGPEAEEAPRLCSCGTPVRGGRCPSCGARTASE